jgi:23S rRNA pseudouridine2604 synthase
MATLKLNKPAAKTGSGNVEKRAPLRGKGVSRPRQTLGQAQAERAAKQAAFEQRQQERIQEERRAAPPTKKAAPPRPARPSFQREEPSAPPPRRDQRRTTGAGPRPVAREKPVSVAGDDGERLSKRMGELGLASRREADEWIAAGWVRVDGEMAVLGQRVGPNARIEVDPAAHREQAKQVTILLHKPIGYVSGQAEDGYEPAAMLIKGASQWREDASGQKFHPGNLRGLAPAGRLDIDSTGLLVLTQDGRIAKTLIGEDSDVEKEYLVRVEHIGQAPAECGPMASFPAEQLARLQHGLELDGVQLKPAKVSWANEDQLRFVLREGRKRQIRRMCELVGLKVVGLKRVRIGRIVLGKLPLGEWRYLAPWERF